MILPDSNDSTEFSSASVRNSIAIDTLPNNSETLMESPNQKNGSHIISRILSPAVRVWLRSQLTEINYLDFTIEGTDRQIWQGVIPSIHLTAKGSVYRGLHLSLAELKTGEIKFIFGKILKGKGWHLDHPIMVRGDIQVTMADLLVSVKSLLFQGAIADLLRKFLPATILNTLQLPLDIHNLHLNINTNLETDLPARDQVLQVAGSIKTIDQRLEPFILQTGLTLLSPQELLLNSLTWSMANIDYVDSLKIFLGSDVYVDNLIIDSTRLNIQGGFRVNP